MDKITRRNALQAIPVFGLAAILPPTAVAAERADAELYQLEAEFNAAYERYYAAIERTEKIEDRAKAARPPEPVLPPMPSDLDDAFVKLTIEQIRDNHPVCQAMSRHREKCRQLTDAWEAECKTIRRESGLLQADAEQSRLCDQASTAANAVLHATAKTPDGILVKMRVHERWTFDDEEILSSIAADIKAMADAAVVPVAAGPAAAEAEHPWITARRLARELSVVLNDCDDGTQMAEVYPSKGRTRSIMFVDIPYLGETARERLNFHGQQYARAAREIDQTATECFFGEALDPDLSNRFSLIVSRKV